MLSEGLEHTRPNTIKTCLSVGDLWSPALPLGLSSYRCLFEETGIKIKNKLIFKYRLYVSNNFSVFSDK